jgi:hypothetical protein
MSVYGIVSFQKFQQKCLHIAKLEHIKQLCCTVFQRDCEDVLAEGTNRIEISLT